MTDKSKKNLTHILQNILVPSWIDAIALYETKTNTELNLPDDMDKMVEIIKKCLDSFMQGYQDCDTSIKDELKKELKNKFTIIK